MMCISGVSGKWFACTNSCADVKDEIKNGMKIVVKIATSMLYRFAFDV